MYCDYVMLQRWGTWSVDVCRLTRPPPHPWGSARIWLVEASSQRISRRPSRWSPAHAPRFKPRSPREKPPPPEGSKLGVEMMSNRASSVPVFATTSHDTTVILGGPARGSSAASFPLGGGPGGSGVSTPGSSLPEEPIPGSPLPGAGFNRTIDIGEPSPRVMVGGGQPALMGGCQGVGGCAPKEGGSSRSQGGATVGTGDVSLDSINSRNVGLDGEKYRDVSLGSVVDCRDVSLNAVSSLCVSLDSSQSENEVNSQVKHLVGGSETRSSPPATAAPSVTGSCSPPAKSAESASNSADQLCLESSPPKSALGGVTKSIVVAAPKSTLVGGTSPSKSTLVGSTEPPEVSPSREHSAIQVSPGSPGCWLTVHSVCFHPACYRLVYCPALYHRLLPNPCSKLRSNHYSKLRPLFQSKHYDKFCP